jgi:NAD(P)-dependent dehydrogenase (short-subunit alcohol dehydrogenase family)
MLDFAGLHVVVTGGTGALGAAVVASLVGRGASVHVPVFDERELDRFACRDDPRVRIVRGVDLAGEAAAAAFFSSLPALWASIHIAGGFAMSPVCETSLEAFRRLHDMNAVSCFLCCREAVRRIRSTAPNAGGRIVNVSAKPALAPVGGMIAYASSKACVASITQCLAEEVAPENILVNAVVPSIMDTPANRAAMPSEDHARWPSVSDVAETIVFLASPQNRSTRAGLVPVFGRS